MNIKEHLTGSNKIFVILFIITLVICVPPFALYGAARFTGSLPSEAVWASRGGNHGPWWDEPQGFLITLACLAMMAMPFVTFFLGLALSISVKNQRLLTFIKGLALATFQFGLGYVLLTSVFWVTD